MSRMAQGDDEGAVKFEIFDSDEWKESRTPL